MRDELTAYEESTIVSLVLEDSSLFLCLALSEVEHEEKVIGQNHRQVSLSAAAMSFADDK
jgi:hypothetical protein